MSWKKKQQTLKIESKSKHQLKVKKATSRSFTLHIKEYKDHHRKEEEAILPDTREGKQRWLYLFLVEDWGVRLRLEANLEVKSEEVLYHLVNWNNELWLHKNERPATIEKDKLIIHRFKNAQYYVMLSQVQLPRKRLEHYLGSQEEAKKLVKRRCSLIEEPKDQVTTAYLIEPISLADQSATQLAVALMNKFVHRRDHRTTFDLAETALFVLNLILKKESNFVAKQKFNQIQAESVIQEYKTQKDKVAKQCEKSGKEHVTTTSSSYYDEALKDHSGDLNLEQMRVRIEARHALNKMQTGATRAQMKQQLQDNNSRINEILFAPKLFQALKGTTKIVSDFTDILGEYAPILFEIHKIEKVKELLIETFQLRAGFGLREYITLQKIGHTKVEIFQVNTFRLRMSREFINRFNHQLNGILFFMEGINFTAAVKGIQKANPTKKDWYSFLGASTAFAASLASVSKMYLDSLDNPMLRDFSAEATKKFAQRKALDRFLTRFIAAAGFVGGILEMLESMEEASETYMKKNWGQFAGYMLSTFGASMSIVGGAGELGASLVQGAGQSASTGFLARGRMSTSAKIGWAGAVLAILGSLAVHYFSESELEEWLRESEWGDRKGSKTHFEQLQKAHYILAKFSVEVAQSFMVKTLTVTLFPGYVTRESTYEVKVEDPGIIFKDKLVGSTNLKVEFDDEGKPKPLEFKVPTDSTLFRIKVSARLLLHGDESFLVPNHGFATWVFEDHSFTSNKMRLKEVDFD